MKNIPILETPLMTNYKIPTLSFVAGVVIGIFSVLIFQGVDTSVTIDENISEIATSTVSVMAENQEAGMFVLVPALSVATTSWVAVRENNNDIMGRILGAARVTRGPHKDVMIELLRATRPKVMYAVVVYEDDGDSAFDHTKDMIVTDESGDPVLSRFVTE